MSPTAPARPGIEQLLAHRVDPERAREVRDGESSLTGRLDAKPVQTAALLVAGVVVVALLLGTLLGEAAASAVSAIRDLDEEAGGLGRDITAAICVALLLGRLGWWRRVGFVGPSHWRDTRLLIGPGLLAALALAAGLSDADLSDGSRVALSLPQPFLTGFWEEGLIRGFFLFALLAAAVRSGSSPLRAVLLSAVVFGLLHLVALAAGGAPGSTLSQVVYATFFGIGFGALLLRTNALWAIVGLHALVNLGPALQDSADMDAFQLSAVLFTLPLAIYGVYLLRRRRGDADHVRQRSP